MQDTPQLIVTGPQDGEALSMAGSLYRIILTGEQTGGTLAVIEMNIPPGSGPIPHEHPAIQESFYVLEGEVEMRTETKTFTAQKGAIVTIPLNGPVHCFKNTADVPARLLCIVAPAGLDDFFKAAGKPAGATPQGPPDDAEKARLGDLAIAYGQKLYPPDYLNK